MASGARIAGTRRETDALGPDTTTRASPARERSANMDTPTVSSRGTWEPYTRAAAEASKQFSSDRGIISAVQVSAISRGDPVRSFVSGRPRSLARVRLLLRRRRQHWQFGPSTPRSPSAPRSTRRPAASRPSSATRPGTSTAAPATSTASRPTACRPPRNATSRGNKWCAALNRGTLNDPESIDINDYYQSAPFNTYSKWVHDTCPGDYPANGGESGFRACKAPRLDITFCPAG